ncbi:conserved exported hypothetical protein [Acidobacteriia bacterium SbA2]|nr:conserved exported hypothetical protein [Acidobacteriia bacterium SbA2]
MRYATSFVCTCLLLMGAVGVIRAQSDRTIVQPQDTGMALINPGMGWMVHHYDNSLTTYTVDLEPSDTVPEFPGVSSVYMRLDWSHLEPEEGKFNWSIVDTPMQKWIEAGKTIAFRFCTSEAEESAPYATPRWVEKAGAKGYHLKGEGEIAPDGAMWEPDFNDPVFLDRLDHFLAAAAARYDGNPHVAFIDVGSFGVWGEGHTVASTRIPYSVATIRKHIDLYKKNFKHTLLVANDDFMIQGRGIEALGYARDQGLTLRDDSILVEPGEHAYYHAYLSYNFWPRLPVILESEHYGMSKESGHWGDGHLLLQAVEDYHASYLTVHWYPRPYLADNRELINRINLRLGYRLQLVDASWPAEVTAAGPMTIGYGWRNAGVAPCLPGGHPTITFKDLKGGIAGVFVDEDFNVRELPVGPPEHARIISREYFGAKIEENDKPLLTYTLPPAHILKPGTYDVYISVGTATGEPVIALPLPNDDGRRRYRLGSIKVAAGK